jgi:hypothetical protein
VPYLYLDGRTQFFVKILREKGTGTVFTRIQKSQSKRPFKSDFGHTNTFIPDDKCRVRYCKICFGLLLLLLLFIFCYYNLKGVGGSSLELGELEQLTINNDNDLNYDQITAPKVHFLPLYKFCKNFLVPYCFIRHENW